MEEHLTVGKREIETAIVRVTKQVTETHETVDVPVVEETVTVERVEMNRFVDEPPAARYEGDTLILPIVKEVPITTVRLMLVEEVRITKHQHTRQATEEVALRQERVSVERVEHKKPDKPDDQVQSS
jgi:uncharacterized protein (TIGR02271 family)